MLFVIYKRMYTYFKIGDHVGPPVDAVVQQMRVVESQSYESISDSFSVDNMENLGRHGRAVHVFGANMELAVWIFWNVKISSLVNIKLNMYLTVTDYETTTIGCV